MLSEVAQPELTIAQKTNWRDIKGGDMATAVEIATAYRLAEASTANTVVWGRTKADMGELILHVCDQGDDIALQNLNVADIKKFKLSLGSKIYGVFYRAVQYFNTDPNSRSNNNRTDVLNRIVKNPGDFTKVPPIVVTPSINGEYIVLDGQHRVMLARDFGSKTQIRGYVIPEKYAQFWKSDNFDIFKYESMLDQYLAKL